MKHDPNAQGRRYETLAAKIDEVLNSDEHRWYLGKMSDAERAQREARATEFKQRYAE